MSITDSDSRPEVLYRLDMPAFCDGWDLEERPEDQRITVVEIPIEGLFSPMGRLNQSTHQLFPSRIAALAQGVIILKLTYEESRRMNEKRWEALEVAQEDLARLWEAEACPS
jgi:hypothetical protein